jgi:hypothetical protein
MVTLLFEALAKPLAWPACGGRHEGLCKWKGSSRTRVGVSDRSRGLKALCWRDNVPVCAGHVGKPRRRRCGVMLERHAWRRGYSLYKTPSTQAVRRRVAGGFASASFVWINERHSIITGKDGVVVGHTGSPPRMRVDLVGSLVNAGAVRRGVGIC